MDETPMKILFVCTGNTCRSAVAEVLFRKMAAEAGLPAEVRSAGVAALEDMPSPPEALKTLSERNADGSAHRSRLLDEGMVNWADLILAMETAHQMMTVLRFPGAVGKIHTLRRYVKMEGPLDIADPIGRPQKVYDVCAAQIEEALKKLLEKISKPSAPGTQPSAKENNEAE
jgi:protein arginine phosphatase